MIYGIEQTSHGNYICPFCKKRKVLKTSNGIIEHVRSEHPTEERIWQSEEAARRAEQKAKAAEEKLRIYSEQAAKKPKQEYYDANVYCTNCRQLNSCGMPKGSLPSNVTCPNCGVCALHLVDNVGFWRAK